MLDYDGLILSLVCVFRGPVCDRLPILFCSRRIALQPLRARRVSGAVARRLSRLSRLPPAACCQPPAATIAPVARRLPPPASRCLAPPVAYLSPTAAPTAARSPSGSGSGETGTGFVREGIRLKP